MVCFDDIVCFVRYNFPQYDDISDEKIRDIILDHIEYGTISIVMKDGKVIAMLRINAEGPIAQVCDLAVSKDHNMRFLTRFMALELWQRFPYLKYFRFARLKKYPFRKDRIYSIKSLVKV